MTDLIMQKFSREPLRGQLLATGTAILEEGNVWGDRFWGVCRDAGETQLGVILMRVRNLARARRVKAEA